MEHLTCAEAAQCAVFTAQVEQRGFKPCFGIHLIFIFFSCLQFSLFDSYYFLEDPSTYIARDVIWKWTFVDGPTDFLDTYGLMSKRSESLAIEITVIFCRLCLFSFFFSCKEVTHTCIPNCPVLQSWILLSIRASLSYPCTCGAMGCCSLV